MLVTGVVTVFSIGLFSQYRGGTKAVATSTEKLTGKHSQILAREQAGSKAPRIDDGEVTLQTLIDH